MDNRRYAEAILTIEEAREAVQETGRINIPLIAEIVIKQSLVLGLAGRTDDAIAPLQGFLETYAEELSPRLLFFVHHTLATHLVCNGEIQAARDALPEIRALLAGKHQAFDKLRLHWLEGRILCAEGALEDSLEIFQALERTFLEQEAVHEAALLALEIAGVLLALGRPTETADHARRALALFLPLQLSKEMHSALALLAQAAERQSASQTLIAALILYAQGGPLPAQLLWL
jgi:tetratricopeptide (TPR) repeat protein